MYFHNVVGTGSYTTSTTNMYNKDFTYRTRRRAILPHPRYSNLHRWSGDRPSTEIAMLRQRGFVLVFMLGRLRMRAAAAGAGPKGIVLVEAHRVPLDGHPVLKQLRPLVRRIGVAGVKRRARRVGRVGRAGTGLAGLEMVDAAGNALLVRYATHASRVALQRCPTRTLPLCVNQRSDGRMIHMPTIATTNNIPTIATTTNIPTIATSTNIPTTPTTIPTTTSHNSPTTLRPRTTSRAWIHALTGTRSSFVVDHDGGGFQRRAAPQFPLKQRHSLHPMACPGSLTPKTTTTPVTGRCSGGCRGSFPALSCLCRSLPPLPGSVGCPFVFVLKNPPPPHPPLPSLFPVFQAGDAFAWHEQVFGQLRRRWLVG